MGGHEGWVHVGVYKGGTTTPVDFTNGKREFSNARISTSNVLEDLTLMNIDLIELLRWNIIIIDGTLGIANMVMG